jgi:sarcosine oxidase, subunit beta
MTRDLIVIGGGLIGLSVAFEARLRGMSVTLLEAQTCGRHASSASAGGVRSLNRHPAEISLARASLEAWRALAGRLGASCGFVASGQVRVAENDAGLARLQARADATCALGWTHERIIGGNELHDRIPSLASHCVGALVVEDDGFADPHATLRAYRRACETTGVDIQEGVPVRAVSRADTGGMVIASDTDTFRASACVNCAGAWGDGFAGGDSVPMRIAALQMIVTAPVPAFVEPVVGCEGRKLSLKQTAAGAVVIGGAFEGRVVHGPRGVVLPKPVSDNLENAVTLFPQLKDAPVLRAWTGLEGMVIDGLPIIGPSPSMAGLVHAFGFSAHGFALVPVIGPLVADLLEGREPDLSIDPFAIGRFAAREAADGPLNPGGPQHAPA